MCLLRIVIILDSLPQCLFVESKTGYSRVFNMFFQLGLVSCDFPLSVSVLLCGLYKNVEFLALSFLLRFAQPIIVVRIRDSLCVWKRSTWLDTGNRYAPI